MFNFKRSISGVMGAAIAVSAMVSAYPVTAGYTDGANEEILYDGSNYSGGGDASAAAVKPELAISKIELTLEEAKAEPTQTVELVVSGADKKYASTELNVFYDSRLTVVLNKKGEPATLGADQSGGGSKLTMANMNYNVNDGNALWLFGAGDDNNYSDGVLWTIKFTLPSDVKVGDLYPIGIDCSGDRNIFRASLKTRLVKEKTDRCGSCKESSRMRAVALRGSLTQQMPCIAVFSKKGFLEMPFTSSDIDQDMQAYLFTQGITNGYIKIAGGEEETPSILYGDVDGDGDVDMDDYAAIEEAYTNYSIGNGYGLTDDEMEAADVDNDGQVSMKDAAWIEKYYVYLSTGGEMIPIREYIFGKVETTTSPEESNYFCGDANCDNEIKLNDAVLIMQAISNPNKFGVSGTDELHITEQGWENADCNAVGDGVTGKDALAIQKFILELIDSLPEE